MQRILAKCPIIVVLWLFIFSISPQRVYAAPLTETEQAKVYWESGQQAKALKLLRAVYYRDRTYGAGIGYAYYLSQANQDQEAIKILTSLIKKHPQKYDADLELIRVYDKIKNDAMIFQTLDQAITRGGNQEIQVVKVYASMYLRFMQPEKALDMLKQFKVTDKNEVDYLGIWAVTNFELKEYTQAKIAYERLVILRPDIPNFSWGLAYIHRKLGNYEEAEMIYNTLKETFPEEIYTWEEMAMLYCDLQQYDKAMAEMDIARSQYLKKQDIESFQNTNIMMERILIEQSYFEIAQ